MMSTVSFLLLLVSSLTTFYLGTAKGQVDVQSHWLAESQAARRNDFFKRWFTKENRSPSAKERSLAASLDFLKSPQKFSGCIDPSEPFQCPNSQRCIALQFICDGHPGDCPDNFDENEETCIAAKRPAKENLEKFFQAEYTLRGLQLFQFLFGEKVANSIKENSVFWFDTLASAFSVSKNIRHFAKKTHMSPSDVAHFQKVLETIHDGRLEDIPVFMQEAVNHGLATLIEKLYESGFMDQAEK